MLCCLQRRRRRQRQTGDNMSMHLVPATSLPGSPSPPGDGGDGGSPRAPAGMESPKLPEIQELGAMLGRVAGDRPPGQQSDALAAFDRAEAERRRIQHEENTRRAQVALERRRNAQQTAEQRNKRDQQRVQREAAEAVGAGDGHRAPPLPARPAAVRVVFTLAGNRPCAHADLPWPALSCPVGGCGSTARQRGA
eukprot:SAG22_NODE_141_length_17948_cov_129.932665_3_plen_194_part_00